MTDQKESAKGFSTCMENEHFAEMMQKIMGQQGIGSLCAEFMKKAGHTDAKSCMARCAGMMQSLRKERDSAKQETTNTKKEESCNGNQQ
jgi:hypothetical protein